MELHIQQPKKERIFFPNLDGLRFFSFFSVFLFHIWLLFFDRFKVPGTTHKVVTFLFQNGEIGVNFFFVLSGFLITYLLIEEKRLTGRIHVINFYIRRILRIWPLFYLCILFGLVLYPLIKNLIGGELYDVAHPWTYFVFLNNFDFMRNGAPAIISVLWSVAIEEQFYLCWPLILSLVPLRKYPYVFFIIILGSIIFRAFHIEDPRVLHFHTLAVIGDMALGGLLAYYIIFSKRFHNFIADMPRLSIGLLYLLALIIFLFRHQLFIGPLVVVERLIIAIVFGLIILEQNFSAQSLFKMSSLKKVSNLGIYTYGLYCLHVIALTFMEQLFRKVGFNMENPIILLVAGLLALVVCIILALISYHYFEKRFLKLKDRFAFIVKK
ncbi:MAG: acyltransferase [Bacteroidetes bacterium]|nr:acyltransferase [Bacteroidota bacterium]